MKRPPASTAGHPIRVTFVLCSLARGGAERVVMDLCRHLDRNRFDVRVATVMGGGVLEDELKALGVPVCIGGRRRLTPGFQALGRLHRFITHPQTDVLHTHLFAGDVWGTLAVLGRRRPVVISTEHAPRVGEGVRHLALRRLTLPLIDRVVAVSDSVRDSAHHIGGIPDTMLEVIPNGVDLQQFPASRLRDPGPGHRLIAVGRLAPEKSYDRLVRVLPRVPNLHLTLVGEGPERGRLEHLAKDLMVDNRVSFAGDRADVAMLLANADIFVQPSSEEGFGLAALEAMATGLTVVASRTGGLRELLEHDRTGWLVPPGDIDALATALKTLSLDRERRKKLSAGAVEAAQGHTVGEMARRYEALYLRCIEKRTVV